MKAKILKTSAVLSMLAAMTLVASGCGQAGTKSSGAPAKVSEASSKAGDHSGWWCPEHGVPEEECSMCNAKVAEACKAKGDWCEEHNRAESQCFICHPDLEAKFAARYEAKYGEKPPKPEAGGEKHEHSEEKAKP